MSQKYGAVEPKISRFMPVEVVGQRKRRILDVQDTTVPCAPGAAGGVEQQWTDEQSAASGHGAQKVGLLPAQLQNALG